MNIFICGIPRSGKTTLSRKLKKELVDYNVIVSESVRNGFQKMEEEHYKEWGSKDSLQRKEKFPKFLFEFLKWNTHFSKCNNIVDLALVDLKTVIDNKQEEDIIVCLGFGGANYKEILKFIRKREKEEDYTFKMSDDHLMKVWGDIESCDKENMTLCKEYGIKYFDVFKSENVIECVKGLL